MSQKDEKENKAEKKENNKADETIMYKPIKSPKQKKPKEKKQKGEKKKHPKLKMFFKVLLVMIILSVVIIGGILAAIVYRCIWGDWAIEEEKLTIKYQNSVMYDKDGNVVAVLTGDENREIISKDEMSGYLPKAFISIEDERFEDHNGVDWKRTLGAFMTFATHSGESSFGGSTITQQVIKNVTDERENSAFEGALRKIKEIVRAYQLESMLSKDQILELYLNLIPLGGGANNIYGVQMASKYYFNKDAKDVTVAEAAYIAGITSAPNRYNPFGETDKSETINNKIKTVLKKMYELGKINEEEYNSGLAEVENGMPFSKGEVSQNNKLSYYLEAAKNQIIEDLMEEKKLSRKEAELQLFGNGYQIYTAYDQKIQADVDAQFVDNMSRWSKTIKVTRTNEETGEKYTEEVQRQGAMAIIDNTTGYVVAGAGGLGEKTAVNGTNRMVLKGHSPGSCMKPIGVIAPSLEEGLITAGTTVDDIPRTFGKYAPKNWYSGYRGYMNIREMLASSTNIPEVALLQQLTVPKALSYLDKMGVDVSAENDVGLSLALGGMTNGITPVELAVAYETIANGGVYKEPKYYSKVTNAAGETILEAKQEETRVLSEQNAWIMQELLSVPIYNGETGGGNARISGQEVRGKTGTTNSNSSAWFCGFTKHYTASVWMGFDREADGNKGGNTNSTQCAILWQAVMSKAHNGLEKKSWDKPGGITTAAICKTSGLLATEDCRHDPEGNKAYSEYFVTGTVPKDYCDIHVKVTVCKKTNLLASENCTEKEERVFITRKNTDESKWKSAADAKYMAPTKTCDTCKAKPKEPEPDTNTVTPGGNTVTPGGNTVTGGSAAAGGNTAKPNTNTAGNGQTKPNTSGTGTGSNAGTGGATKPSGTGAQTGTGTGTKPKTN